MASRRVLSHLLRSTTRRSKPAAFSSPRPPSPAPLSRPNPAGFFLSRAVQYATSAAAAEPAKAPVSPSAGPSGKITDEFTGAGSIGKVCHVKDIFIDVRFDEGMPPKLTALEVLDNSVRSELMVTQHLGNNMVRTIQVYGTEDLVRGQRVLNTGSPFFGIEAKKHYDTSIADGSDESTATTQPAFATVKHATRLGLDPPRGSRSARKDTYTAQLQEQIQTLTQESVTMRQQLDTMRQQWEADRARLASLKARQREIEQFMADYMARGGNNNA